jgi:hypothetical protein
MITIEYFQKIDIRVDKIVSKYLLIFVQPERPTYLGARLY